MDLLEWDRVTPWVQKRGDHSFKITEIVHAI